MITKEQLAEAIRLIKEANEYTDKIYNDYRLDISETPMFQCPGRLFDLLIESHYTEEGADWIYWWCFECDFGEHILDALDEDGSLICQTFDELYEYCEKYWK